MRCILTALAALAVSSTAVPLEAQRQIEIVEWEVPYEESRPRDPYVGPDGKVWFVGQRSDYVAYLDRDTGEFTKFELDDGVGPHNLVVAEDGTVFFTGNLQSHIGILDPETGDVERVTMPEETARDPHTLIFDQSGDLWFTVQFGNYVGHLERASREVRLVKAPEIPGRRPTSRPYGIKMDSHDVPWAVLFNTSKIATVDPETFEMTTYDLPDDRSRPRRLVIDSGDAVWYVDYALGRLGRFDPHTGEVEEWAMPSGESSRPYGVEIDPDDRIWFVETGVQPNIFVGFDPATEEFFSQTPVGSGGGTIRHMYYEAATNSVWFGTDANTVGQAKLPPLKKKTGGGPIR
jgi:virginiamycin B lyase